MSKNQEVISTQKFLSTSELHNMKSVLGMETLSNQDPRIQYLMAYGDFSMSYSTLQDNLDYFILPGIGYIAFRKVIWPFNNIHVLGDPVCQPEMLPIIIKEFLGKYKNVCFSQVSYRTAKVIHSTQNFYATQFGIETIIYVDQFIVKGNSLKDLCRYRNKCIQAEVMIKDVTDNPPFVTLAEISKIWMSGKTVHGKEMEFLARKMTYEREFDVRYFVATNPKKEIFGFVIYDPIYKDGKVIGYQGAIQRALPDIPMGTLDFIHFHACEQFKKEGKKFLSLGFSPFAQLKGIEQMESPSALEMFKRFYDYGDILYSFQGLAQHKDRYMKGPHNKVIQNPVFFCSAQPDQAWQILEEYILCGVINIKNASLFMNPRYWKPLIHMFFG
jgi:lysylphosphatidylglycerol synthetase-like protein (DUF2156 family)